jgi:cyclophilin family peptidyl-prolyl cis-trans isomerase
VSNFLALCKGVEVDGRQLGYAGCPFTRIMARFMLQAGDVVNRDGSGAGTGLA